MSLFFLGNQGSFQQKDSIVQKGTCNNFTSLLYLRRLKYGHVYKDQKFSYNFDI